MPQDPVSRRSFLAVPAALGAAAALELSCNAPGKSWAAVLDAAESRVHSPAGALLPGLVVQRSRNASAFMLRLKNTGATAERVGEVYAFSFAHGLPPQTPIYTEGFQMLSQTAGSIAKPEDIGGYTDRKHYRLPSPEAAFTGYNLLNFGNPAANHPLFAFTSCHRFSGCFHISPDRLEIALDLDGRTLAPGEQIELEHFSVFEGGTARGRYELLAQAIGANHPPILGPEPPQGWCSWYCFGPNVTADQVMSNLDFIAREIPSLRYIQIDDGYQSAMGDWLDTGKAFGGDVRKVLRQIKERGFEPAIWVAPFIAEESSAVFQQHPDWFMKTEEGTPLASDKVTFGGWRRGPWYALDGSNPAVQQHFESVFRTMREEWGVTYFKLDANFWGVMPSGKLYDPKATRIEAYRRGMEAIRRGAGDAFLLGCNHPLWPSLGLIHGSRSSNDTSRRWRTVSHVARENLQRGWQNGQLWWNDPDVVVLTGDLSDDEFLFHATSVYASGGMLLAGDDLPQLSPARLAMLRKLSPPTGQAAVFDAHLKLGRLRQPQRELLFVLNWTASPEAPSPEIPGVTKATDFWTGDELHIESGKLPLVIAPHGARIIILE